MSRILVQFTLLSSASILFILTDAEKMHVAPDVTAASLIGQDVDQPQPAFTERLSTAFTTVSRQVSEQLDAVTWSSYDVFSGALKGRTDAAEVLPEKIVINDSQPYHDQTAYLTAQGLDATLITVVSLEK